MKKTVSLVLGSGGARGMAHVGVIKYLEEQGIEIKSISGCSIGSVIGGAYAAGKLDVLTEWMLSIEKIDILSMLDISWKSSGLIQGETVIKKLKGLIGDLTIEELAIPYTAVAADIKNQKEVWINKGSLYDAIRASVSIPLFLTPVVRDGVVLVDGGVLNPVPIAPTFKDKTDFTLAVNLGGDPLPESENVEETTDEPWWMNRVNEWVDELKESAGFNKTKEWGAYDVADQAFDTMQAAIARTKLAAYPPDVTITIARNACGTLDFDRSEELMKLGYEKTKEVFAEF